MSNTLIMVIAGAAIWALLFASALALVSLNDRDES